MADIHSLENVDFEINCGTNTLPQDADGLCSVVSQGRKDTEAAEVEVGIQYFFSFWGWQSSNFLQHLLLKMTQ